MISLPHVIFTLYSYNVGVVNGKHDFRRLCCPAGRLYGNAEERPERVLGLRGQCTFVAKISKNRSAPDGSASVLTDLGVYLETPKHSK